MGGRRAECDELGEQHRKFADVAAAVAQAGKGLPLAGAEFQVIHGLAEHISADNVIGGAAEIVVAEPYYEILEGWRTSRRRSITFTPSARW